MATLCNFGFRILGGCNEARRLIDWAAAVRRVGTAAADWQASIEKVERTATANQKHRLAVNGSPTLNRATLEFIRDGAATGDRHRMVFSSAANLAEFGCPFELTYALLSEAALDTGLPPAEVRRQIECGIERGRQ